GRRIDHVAQRKRSRAAFELGHDHDLHRHVELTVGKPVGDAQALAAGLAGNLGTAGQIVDRDQITIWHFFILLEMELLKTPTPPQRIRAKWTGPRTAKETSLYSNSRIDCIPVFQPGETWPAATAQGPIVDRRRRRMAFGNKDFYA